MNVDRRMRLWGLVVEHAFNQLVLFAAVLTATAGR
jgi:hypothetical protein